MPRDRTLKIVVRVSAAEARAIRCAAASTRPATFLRTIALAHPSKAEAATVRDAYTLLSEANTEMGGIIQRHASAASPELLSDLNALYQSLLVVQRRVLSGGIHADQAD